MRLNQLERVSFGFEFWHPAKIAAPRLVMGYDAIVAGQLFALTSEVYSPGPFDDFGDVLEVVHDKVNKLELELVSGTDGSCS